MGKLLFFSALSVLIYLIPPPQDERQDYTQNCTKHPIRLLQSALRGHTVYAEYLGINVGVVPLSVPGTFASDTIRF